MELNKSKLISTLLANPKIMARIKELKLTKEQIEEALPIMIDMNNEKEEDRIYLTSFFLTANGSIKRMEILSKKGKKFLFKNNIVSQDLYQIEFDENKEFFRNSTRGKLMTKFVQLWKTSDYTKGIYIHGKTGVGKTFIMKMFARTLAEKEKKIGFINLPILVSKVKGSFNKLERYEEIIKTLTNVEYLFIDDIGVEAISTWFRDEFLFRILNTRTEKNKTTFFASNYSLSELEKIEARTSNTSYKDFDKSKRLINRVQILAEPILLDGKNLRN